jgi:ferredoxin
MQFDAKFQIVQKCDLCGGNPACVPFCPTKAIDYKPVQEVLGRSLKRTG